MSNLQIIEALELLCEQQARVVRAMALRLGELGDVALTDEIAAADQRYREILGANEWPDDAIRKNTKKHKPGGQNNDRI